MEIAALSTWIATMLVGAYMFATTSRLGREPEVVRRTQFPAPVLLTHPSLALAGFGFWVAYLNHDHGWLAWTAFGFLVAAAVLGDVLVLHWVRERRGREPVVEDGVQVAEQDVPTVAVVTHGVLAVTTILLVLLVALGVG